MTDLNDMAAVRVWDDVIARVVHGTQISLAVVEIPAGAVVPQHQHRNEQLGVLLRGSVRFTIGSEVRELVPGAVWCIPGDVPHEVVAGPQGAVVVEAFAPRRADWDTLNRADDPPLTWPGNGNR
jgi:quercetin dioxygenase-like cupin family protein